MSNLRLELRGKSLKALIPELEYEGRKEKGKKIDLQLSQQEREELRWLQENFKVDLYEPGKGRRGRAEAVVGTVGRRLYQALSSGEKKTSSAKSIPATLVSPVSITVTGWAISALVRKADTRSNDATMPTVIVCLEKSLRSLWSFIGVPRSTTLKKK